MKIYRMGHVVFRLLEQSVPVLRSSMRNGFDLHSESGRITHVNGVQGARTKDGELVMIAPGPATIEHPEHGRMELPPGVYAVEDVKEARPDEQKARSLRFETPAERTTALTREQLD